MTGEASARYELSRLHELLGHLPLLLRACGVMGPEADGLVRTGHALDADLRAARAAAAARVTTCAS